MTPTTWHFAGDLVIALALLIAGERIVRAIRENGTDVTVNLGAGVRGSQSWN